MKKLLMGTAIVFATTQAVYAVEDARILQAIKSEMHDMPELCAHLEALPEPDKRRLAGLVYGKAANRAQKQIQKLIDDNIELESCINYIGSPKPGW